jgi:hypothetical protein
MRHESTAHKYGKFYWCIGVSKDVSENGEIYAHADWIELQAGALVLQRAKSAGDEGTINEATGGRQILLTLAPGQWKYAFAASVLDGHAVAVEHWPGEIAE